MSPDGPHSLTLVLSSARSGSSLLCRDLRSLGGLGFPKEYLKGLDKQARRGPVSDMDVLERVAQGCQDDAPGVAATKLMVYQAGFTYKALNGDRAGSLPDALSGVVSWARARFDRVLLVVLVRGALDQAISRAVAQATGTYHSTDRGYRRLEAGLLPVDDINQRILGHLDTVVRDRNILFEVHAAHADLGLLVTYDQLTRQVVETEGRLVAHARAAGFQVQNDTFIRKLKKVISPERSVEIRESFLEYLSTETGVVWDDSVDSPQAVPQVDAPGR